MSDAGRVQARRPIVCVCVIAASAALHAQAPALMPVQPPALAATLTIDQAVKEGLDHNLSLLAERYSVSIADARILAARLRPNPVFTYDAMIPDSTVYNANINPFENVFRGDVIVEGGGKRERRIEVAEQARSVTRLQLANTMRTIILDVQGAFLDVALAKSNVALARESLQAFNDIVRANTERVRAGDLAPVELTRSRLAAMQFQNDVRQQEAKLVVAKSHLKTLLGRTGPDSIDVDGDWRHDSEAVDQEVLEARALRERPDLLALRQDQARSSADIRLQIAQGKIDYTFSGEYHHQQSPLGTGNQYGVYVSVPVPIFNRNQGEVERARQEEHQTEARVRALEADLSSEVQSAYESYAASRDVVQRIEADMLTAARDVRATTEYAYRRGEASFVELLDAVRAFNETMESYNEARADYARSLYTLDSVSGASVSTITSSTVTP